MKQIRILFFLFIVFFNITYAQALEIKEKLTDFGFEITTNRQIKYIILHSSYDKIGEERNNNPYDIDGLINEYRQYDVSPHYVIDRNGIIYQLVSDENIAWQAGKSKTPDNITGLNKYSIGIELIYKENESPNEYQKKSLEYLIKYLMDKYNIRGIYAHSIVAIPYGRKSDPWGCGYLFWNELRKNIESNKRSH